MVTLNWHSGEKQKSTSANRADEIREQIEKDYPEIWLRGFEFSSFRTDEELKAHLFKEIEESGGHRVLVVGGTSLFEKVPTECLSRFDIYIKRGRWECGGAAGI
jgi:hypothetical protein